MKYLIYARISPRGSDFDHTADNSTEMQIEYCKAYIREKGGIVAGTVKDEFLSGKNMKRPGIQSIIEDLENNRADWDCFCVYNLSRLTRSPQDMYDFMGILSRHNKKFLSIREPEFDFSTMQGELMMGIITHINQYMRKQSAANVHDKMMAIAAKGLWPAGLAPYGYKRGEKKDNRLYVDPEKALIIKEIFELYATDKPTRTIQLKFKKFISRARIYSILRDPVYLGKIKYGGEVFQGQHEPLVSQELFQAVQNKLPQAKIHARPKAYSYPFLLTGLIFCQCGSRLTPGTAKSGQYAYYTCTDITCKKRISAPKVEEEVLKNIGKCKLTEKVLKAAITEVVKRQEEEFKVNQPKLQEYKKLQKDLLTEKQQIIDKILYTDSLSPLIISSLNERAEKIEQELEMVQARFTALESCRVTEDDYWKAGIEFLKKLRSLAQIIQKETNRDRLRTIIPLFIRRIRLQENGTFAIEMNEPISSTNSIKWCTVWNLLEPVYFTFKVA